MAKWYKKEVINPGRNGSSRLTVTRSSDGSIRTTLGSGPKWARITTSFKDGKTKVTRSSIQDGWFSRTSKTEGGSTTRRRTSRKKTNSSVGFWILVLVCIIIIF
jgi:hypothetical protein